MNFKRTKWTPYELQEAIKASRNWRQTLLRLGLYAGSGNYERIRRFAKESGFDTSHFDRKIYPKGGLLPPTVNRRSVKARFIKETGTEYKCNSCGLNNWMDRPISLHLDHINGINTDNRFENLQLLCPNCHSQTNTYAGRNAKYRSN